MDDLREPKRRALVLGAVGTVVMLASGIEGWGWLAIAGAVIFFLAGRVLLQALPETVDEEALAAPPPYRHIGWSLIGAGPVIALIGITVPEARACLLIGLLHAFLGWHLLEARQRPRRRRDRSADTGGGSDGGSARGEAGEFAGGGGRFGGGGSSGDWGDIGGD